MWWGCTEVQNIRINDTIYGIKWHPGGYGGGLQLNWQRKRAMGCLSTACQDEIADISKNSSTVLPFKTINIPSYARCVTQ